MDLGNIMPCATSLKSYMERYVFQRQATGSLLCQKFLLNGIKSLRNIGVNDRTEQIVSEQCTHAQNACVQRYDVIFFPSK